MYECNRDLYGRTGFGMAKNLFPHLLLRTEVIDRCIYGKSTTGKKVLTGQLDLGILMSANSTVLALLAIITSGDANLHPRICSTWHEL